MNKSIGISERLENLPMHLYALNFSSRKKKFLICCFPGKKISFIKNIEKIKKNTALILWGSTPCPNALPLDFPIVRVEDGFLRSVGLGVELTRPLSWIVDTKGIYFDATKISDLECILKDTIFSEEQLSRAAALHQLIIESGITKYNVGSGEWKRPAHAKKVILVPGQVESDASIAKGAADIRNNMTLLKSVREKNPDAYVLYKPHPDVVARLRISGIDEEKAFHWCDECIIDIPMEKLLMQIDEVHTMTSLTGFEALLRGKSVTCYGNPFYAGWGLTTDIHPLERRSRNLSLNALIAGALIIYPCYFNDESLHLISPEAALALLNTYKIKKQGKILWWRAIYRSILRKVIGIY